MAKFYVQSGNLQRIIDSPSAEHAAIWAVHQAMQQIAPQFSDVDKPCLATEQKIIVLGESIEISETGFTGELCLEMDTFTAFRKWYALCELVDF